MGWYTSGLPNVSTKRLTGRLTFLTLPQIPIIPHTLSGPHHHLCIRRSRRRFKMPSDAAADKSASGAVDASKWI